MFTVDNHPALRHRQAVVAVMPASWQNLLRLTMGLLAGMVVWDVEFILPV
jgi:hypothetical protein